MNTSNHSRQRTRDVFGEDIGERRHTSSTSNELWTRFALVMNSLIYAVIRRHKSSSSGNFEHAQKFLTYVCRRMDHMFRIRYKDIMQSLTHVHNVTRPLFIRRDNFYFPQKTFIRYG